VQALDDRIDRWHLATTGGERGLDAGRLRQGAFAQAAAGRCQLHASVAEALEAARSSATPDDRIVIFGSFVIVADAMRWLERGSR